MGWDEQKSKNRVCYVPDIDLIDPGPRTQCCLSPPNLSVDSSDVRMKFLSMLYYK